MASARSSASARIPTIRPVSSVSPAPLGRFARISFGHTQQRVTRLGVDQTLGEQLDSADDLRTRERFDASWYAALAFTISELPIFKND